MKTLQTKFCNVTFPSPLISVSGIVTSPQANAVLAKEKGIGAITWKSVSLRERKSHPVPVVVPYSSGYINSVGLQNPGLEQAAKDILHIKKQIRVPLIISIVAFQISEFYPLALGVAKTRPDFIEINLSCPNVDDEAGKPFGTDLLMTTLAIQEVKRAAGDIPVIAKLTPNVVDITEFARAAEEAGADAISAINTSGPGLLIDVSKRKPKLGHKIGGISGKAIKPLALRCVYEIAKTVNIPIIGIGGVSTGEDAIEMIMVGATLVGVGSAIFGVGNSIFPKIAQQMQDIMEKHHIRDLKSIKKCID
ncbi:MAG: Dihydroorotate dehydrogenase [Candidatus Gottesmanbacteria bacterium GW2011_GWB1_43_11]|uniref:Dihydroorotate dehydrogenase n=1 Tax=Candidatus Gottesmanbacteria bacterium GW2011_GWB1_43_11 TaxID=1618446 RepID=A0A0G1CLI2_9BACT|nr:MAG: Dihydroorotate dehydrogenase [Candidatus Gottesmanbacteria bacterium GW2011_GWA2_42_16]KKS55797.1 MAG: Dihydroorotate dehydrogenase [Candidatus Gottesmanbacteria bacterium GW2011_GWA1_42_26]KKS82005.1 MAG: Dihydroorotate dehydrogenase [Candidatus Gottesmanbacteria bacterium GW2011_GWC1_43_10]KKS86364.1 MAG: Dihydroorotate dehydrogenase [Candidatus Gottesmanbacteria bacterium GW2011_GWB1_43_11]OGG09768.1 MAG: hypothetical protein A2699_04310 [Candidatus Gottesmanbacteria bacterium RIFCSP